MSFQCLFTNVTVERTSCIMYKQMYLQFTLNAFLHMQQEYSTLSTSVYTLCGSLETAACELVSASSSSIVI
jgi:hypothetical protein